MTENQEIKYLQRIVRLCAAHKANPNHTKGEIDEIRQIAEHVISNKIKGKSDDITGTPV
jgi:hypothetical protein